MLFVVVCCLLIAGVGCLLSVVRCGLSVVCWCLLFVVCRVRVICLLLSVRRLPHMCCVLIVGVCCLLFVVCCLLFVVC